jgi:hypothetical protein
MVQSLVSFLFELPRASLYQIFLDTILMCFAAYVFMKRPDKPEKPLTTKEIDQLIEEWQPDHLFPKMDERKLALGRKVPTIKGSTTTHVNINNKQIMSFARTNFLGMIGNKEIEEAVVQEDFMEQLMYI